jgi:hypothetical protein
MVNDEPSVPNRRRTLYPLNGYENDDEHDHVLVETASTLPLHAGSREVREVREVREMREGGSRMWLTVTAATVSSYRKHMDTVCAR